jgi:hypothetical protein
MKNTTNNLPPNLQSLAYLLLDAQPSEVQEAFQFLLATATHEHSLDRRCTTKQVGGRHRVTD